MPRNQNASPYTSKVRAEGPRRTREAIVLAATALFLERGYEGASLSDIAGRAGVARPTVVAAFGTKPALLSRVLDEALAGDDEPLPVRDRPWFRPVREATTAQDVLRAYSHVCVVIGRRAGAVAEMLRRGSDSAPEVADLWRSFLRGRHAGAAMVVERDLVLASLRPDLTPDAAIDVLWRLNDPDHYVSLVTSRGWDEASFEAWLADAMIRLLLRDVPLARSPKLP